MSKTLQYIGLDVHKDSIAVAIAPQNTTEAHHYGIIGGTLDAVDKFVKKLSSDNLELRFVYEAGPCGYVKTSRGYSIQTTRFALETGAAFPTVH